MSLKNILSKKNRALLRELIATDFKLRYQGSVLGYLWSLLKPLFLFVIMYTVFGHFLKIGSSIENYPIYLLLGIVLWGFFTEATGQGLISIVARGDLIRKVNFPKYIIVVSSTLSALINLGINLVVVGVFMIFNRVDIHWSILWFPLLVIELYMFSLALAFFFSAFFVRYRDINHIWEVAQQALFYATPVLYPIGLVVSENAKIAKLLMLSPLAQIIQDARYSLVTHQTTTIYSLIHSFWLILVPFVIIVLAIALATYYFKKNAKYFAENI